MQNSKEKFFELFDYNIREKVLIKAISMYGYVDALCREESCSTYRVVYWNEGTRHRNWLYDYEIDKIKE